MSYPHHLSESEWNQFIEEKRFKIIERITPEILGNLNVEGSLYLQTTRENAKIPYDRHQWSHSQKGSIPRHQPAYKRMIIQGIITHSIRCTSVSNPEFKKDVLHLGNATYYHYFLAGNGVYREPEEDEIKKPRITGES
uniref:Transposase n=1 Tax=Caenorhabditis tropicalis TaxID=1561998 RepID=A0A1I7V4G9_9PELO